MTRRILDKIELTEISAVDRPAQEGARVTIMKREVPDMPPPPTFDAAVDAIMKSAGCSRLDAMSSARLAYPSLYDSYQADQPVVEKVDRTPPPAVTEFMRLVNEQQVIHKCSRSQAMSLARKQHPDAYEELQQA